MRACSISHPSINPLISSQLCFVFIFERRLRTGVILLLFFYRLIIFLLYRFLVIMPCYVLLPTILPSLYIPLEYRDTNFLSIGVGRILTKEVTTISLSAPLYIP